VTIALGVTRALFLLDANDSVEAVVAVFGCTTLGAGNEVAVDHLFFTTLLVSPVPLFVPSGEEAGEPGITPVGVDDDRSLLRRGVASAPVVLSVFSVEFSVLAPDDV
jgi:hypothetical protein